MPMSKCRQRVSDTQKLDLDLEPDEVLDSDDKILGMIMTP